MVIGYLMCAAKPVYAFYTVYGLGRTGFLKKIINIK